MDKIKRKVKGKKAVFMVYTKKEADKKRGMLKYIDEKLKAAEKKIQKK